MIDPEKTIPARRIWGTAITTVIYVLRLLDGRAAAAHRPARRNRRRRSPMWCACSGAAMPRCCCALFAFISGFGALNGWILVHGEMPAALARAGVFPKFFARQSKYGTPGTSLFITGGLLTILVLFNYTSSMVVVFAKILLIATLATLVTYLCCCGGGAEARLAGRSRSQGKSLGVLSTIAILGAIYSIWTIFGAGLEAFYWGIGLFVAGVPVYVVMKKLRRDDAVEKAIGRRAAALKSFFDHAERLQVGRPVRARCIGLAPIALGKSMLYCLAMLRVMMSDSQRFETKAALRNLA